MEDGFTVKAVVPAKTGARAGKAGMVVGNAYCLVYVPPFWTVSVLVWTSPTFAPCNSTLFAMVLWVVST